MEKSAYKDLQTFIIPLRWANQNFEPFLLSAVIPALLMFLNIPGLVPKFDFVWYQTYD
jgi:hypothetical protein